MNRIHGVVSEHGQAIPPGLMRANQRLEANILKRTLRDHSLPSALVQFDFHDLYKALSVTARRVVDEINALLKQELPDGLQSLEPAEMTPEKTAGRIVDGIRSLFPAFAKQNPELQGEALVDAFMEQVNSGVDKGYEDAIAILEGLEAFQFEGVRDAVESTRTHLDEKLVKLQEDLKRTVAGVEKPEPKAEEPPPEPAARKQDAARPEPRSLDIRA